ncbi:phage-related minor tail protein [Pseudaminobacter salicylatoxidans]|uniref:Phage-related minor tail protein n=1 Tax=Pseudaminobacter salicylatoxidans TaxID=93369 RepID=A0A316C5P6_PSESE|nr:phage tail length tape measure family protein [Pseudaminobacter salicylatoxidans]PWJ84868.1 phage-related minor tail protein [Pseudaminobacter salicylatoxidans]
MVSDANLAVGFELRVRDVERQIARVNKSLANGMRQAENRAAKASTSVSRSLSFMGKEVEGHLAGMGARLGPLGSGISALGTAGTVAAAGIGALVLGLTAGMSSAAQAETIFRRLDAVLKLAGNAAGMTAGQIDGFAKDLERATGIAATEINAAAAALATYTNISGERFKGIIKLSTDMVAVYGGNLREWSDKIARAIDDPIQGFAALKRAGFQLTDAQLETVEAMRKVGDVAGYQTEMVKILSDSLGGAAGAQNQGMAGAAIRAKNAVGAFLEEMARWSLIRGPVEGTLNAIASGLDGLAAKAERMRNLEVDVGFNVVTKNRELFDFEDRLQKMQDANVRQPGTFAPEQLDAVRQQKERLEREIDDLIQRGHKEVAELTKVETGERVAQWGAATDLIKDNATAAEEAGKIYLTTREKLAALGQGYDDTKTKIAQARDLWKESGAGLAAMTAEEKAAYDARGKAIDEWAAAELNAFQRHQAALQKQIESEAKRGASARATRDEVRSLISDLEHELSIIGQSSTAQRISNELRRLGAKATQDQKDQIAGLITKIDAQKESQEAANKAQKDFNDGMQQLESDAVDALGQVIAGTENAADAFKRLAIEIVKSAITGKGAYADFFAALTKGSGGGLSGILGSLFGGGGSPNFAALSASGKYLFDEGGYTGPGGVKQPAGVVHKGEVVFSQKDVARHGGVAAVEAIRRGMAGYAAGGPVGLPTMPTMPQIRMPTMPKLDSVRAANQQPIVVNFSPNIDARGASVEAVARLEQVMARQKRDFEANVINTIRSANRRGVKY